MLKSKKLFFVLALTVCGLVAFVSHMSCFVFEVSWLLRTYLQYRLCVVFSFVLPSVALVCALYWKLNRLVSGTICILLSIMVVVFFARWNIALWVSCWLDPHTMHTYAAPFFNKVSLIKSIGVIGGIWAFNFFGTKIVRSLDTKH